MQLSKTKRYSPNDHALFKLLPKKKGDRIDSKTLTKRFYKGKIPLNGQQCVMAGVRLLRKKIDHYGEAFALVISPRRGPWPVELWIEGRKRR